MIGEAVYKQSFFGSTMSTLRHYLWCTTARSPSLEGSWPSSLNDATNWAIARFSATWKILKTWYKPGICQTWKNMEFQLDTWKNYNYDFHALIYIASCDPQNRKGIMNRNIIINSLASLPFDTMSVKWAAESPAAGLGPRLYVSTAWKWSKLNLEKICNFT